MQNQPNMETEQPMPDEGSEPQGIDGIIAMVDGYLSKPETVTPDTLMDLRTQLEDLKSILEPESAGDEPPSGAPEGGLAGMLAGGR